MSFFQFLTRGTLAEPFFQRQAQFQPTRLYTILAYENPYQRSCWATRERERGHFPYLHCASSLCIFIAYLYCVSSLHIFTYCISSLHIFIAYPCCISVETQKRSKTIMFFTKSDKKVALLMKILVRKCKKHKK